MVLADVCGEVVANGIFFGAWGWRKNMKFSPPAPPPPAPEPVSKGYEAPALPMRAPLTRNRTSAGTSVHEAAGSISSLLIAVVLGFGLILLL